MAFNIWERWPWTSFQNLNLEWLMKAVKEAVTSSAAALAKATAVEADVGTYTDQITAANNTANQAMNIARNADDVLFIYSDSENKAVDYKQHTEGVTTYITAPDIFSAVIADHKVPVFMDTNMYFYDMAGYETNPEQPLMVTRVKFVKDGVNRQDIVWIDRNGAITYTTTYRGAGTFVVNITNSQATGSITSDKTYSEISNAYNSGMTVQCHVVDEIRNQEYYAYDCFFTENSETGDYFGWVSPYDYSNTRFYRAFVREDNHVGISVLPISGGGGGISIQDVIDTVNNGDTNALLSTAQTLSAAEQAQVKQNLGITSGGSYSPYIIPVTLSNGVYSTTATGEDVLGHILDCRIVFNGVYYYQIGSGVSGAYGTVYFASTDPSNSGVIENDIFAVTMNGASNVCTVTKYEKDIKLLPDTTSASADDFLMLDSNKNPAWVAVPNAANVSFGGA